MKRAWSFLVLFSVALCAFPQSRENIRIYIPPVIASTEQALYFHENFAMETQGAGYTLTDNIHDADYTLKLEVKPNMILYDDGYEEPAPPDEPQFALNIHLIRNEDELEIVAFSFLFDNVEEMYDYNLYLLYEAMANVPLSKPLDTIVENDDRWRNKWLYFRLSLDYPITFYALKEPSFLTQDPSTFEIGQSQPQMTPLNHRISPWLAVTAGVELQYLYWMSTEISFNLSFSDPMSSAFIPAFQVEQKFPIKPGTHFMIEPYAAVSFPVNTSPDVIQFPRIGVGGGVELVVKGGNMGGFFVDINYIYFLGDVIMRQTNPYYSDHREVYSRFEVGLGIGYKIGFFDRPKRKTAISVVPDSESSTADTGYTEITE